MEFAQLFCSYLRYCIRIIFITVANLFGIPTYIVWNILLYPVRKYHPDLYWTHIEPTLFKGLIGIVASWLYSAGYKVIETGDDLHSIINDEALVLVNHQSTSDVPFLMTSMYNKGCGHMTWLMDHIFKFSNFGWCSVVHGDFFILQGKDGRDEQLIKLKKHMYESYIPTGKKWMIVFPEGGFLYKRRKSSQNYAKKNNYPVLEHVTLPRIGSVQVITDSLYYETQRNGFSNGSHENRVPAQRRLKWVIDLTVGYPDGDSLSFPGMVAGIYSPRHVHLHYRAYSTADLPSDSEDLQQWLYDRYSEKEELLEKFYKYKQSMGKTDEQKRSLKRVTEQELQIPVHSVVISYILYCFSSYIFWHCFYKHLFFMAGFMFSLIF